MDVVRDGLGKSPILRSIKGALYGQETNAARTRQERQGETLPEVATPNQAEREFETGTDEFFKSQSQVNALNAKRTYDEYQAISLETARRGQTQADILNNLATQALQNAVETANMVGKQNIQLNALAHDSFWNPVANGAGMNLTAGAVPANRAVDVAAAGTSVSAEAVSAAVAKQVDATITPVLAVLQQLVQGIASMNASMANVIAQTQPQPKG